jgi:mRNA-degrading endonuclease RelE of RelBE toxin-antitoxin system
MEIKYGLRYEEHVSNVDIPKLPLSEKTRIENAILQKLRTKPEVYGKPLRKSLKGHWALRIGDHRAVYRIIGDTVNIFAIGNRSTIYQVAERRVR